MSRIGGGMRVPGTYNGDPAARPLGLFLEQSVDGLIGIRGGGIVKSNQ